MTSNDELRKLAEAARPCICGKLWEFHNENGLEHHMSCLCGITLSRVPVDDIRWFLQHGPNPEHRSPVYESKSTLAACDWVDSVCLSERS